jgi:polar amino acid transport system substrate-binding protein
MIRLLLLLLFVPGLLLQQAKAEPDAGTRAMLAASNILDQARAEAAKGCSNPSDVLVSILCAGRLHVGLRTYYPEFSVRDLQGQFHGYEPDIARRIAEFLGVAYDPVVVNPKNRIPMVADGHVDLVISTMGHSLQRGGEVHFIRPHYYISQTAIVGPNNSQAAKWTDFEGRTVCLPLGSNSNIDFVRHHVRVLTFDRPEQLLDALRFNECRFIVQDDTFFADLLANPGWSAQFGIRFRFAPLPWGMAVARTGATQWASLLQELSIVFHARGVFVQIAEAHHLDLTFLREEQKKWSSDACVTADGAPIESCLLPPVDNRDASDDSPIKPYAMWLQTRLTEWSGMQINLSALMQQSTFSLLQEGIAYSLALIIGTQFSTVLFALGLGYVTIFGPRTTRRAIGAATGLAQVTPLPLVMFFVYVLAGGIAAYSGLVALVAAILAIGLYNGSNAAHAIDEAYSALLRGTASSATPAVAAGPPRFLQAVSLANVQIVAFLINAAKGSPAAGMIGVPEFLNVVTDLSANATDRVGVNLLLLIFYSGLVLIVIAVLGALRVRLVASGGLR